MEKWEKKKPNYCDHIRVFRGLYYHHGLYLDDNNIVNFRGSANDDVLNPELAMVRLSTLDEFLNGGSCEVRIYTCDELNKMRPKNEIANYALSRLGEKGYNILTNNCEHFVNSCVFNVAYSHQVDQAKAIVDSLIKGGNYARNKKAKPK